MNCAKRLARLAPCCLAVLLCCLACPATAAEREPPHAQSQSNSSLKIDWGKPRPHPELEGVLTFDIEFEEPRQHPKGPSEPLKNTGQWPFTLEEAVNDIVSGLSEEDKQLLRDTPRKELIKFHMGWGMAIRNSYGLWGGNEELLLSACGGKRCHADSASMRIIEGVWERLRSEAP